MLSLLALETTTDACSAALTHCGRVFVRQSNVPRQHAKEMLPFVDSLLKEAGLTLQELDAIAVTHGPGSFTGIRIGLGVAQGLAFGSSKPIVTATTLELLALKTLRLEFVRHMLVLMDARMGQYYAASFEVKNAQSLHMVTPLQLLSVADITALPQDEMIVVSGACAPTLHDLGLPIVAMEPEALDLLPIAATRLQQGLGLLPAHVDPLYVRSDVAVPKQGT